VEPKTRGESLREGGSTEVRVPARTRANRCVNRAPCRQTCGTTVQSCLASQGARSARLKRPVDLQRSQESDTTEGVLGRSSILSQWQRGFSPTGEDGGTILVRRVKPYTVRQRGRRCGSRRSAWNRRAGARGRQGTSEDGTISMKAPPAVARTTKRGGSASRTPKGVVARECQSAAPAAPRGRRRRGCIEVGSAEASVSE